MKGPRLQHCTEFKLTTLSDCILLIFNNESQTPNYTRKIELLVIIMPLFHQNYFRKGLEIQHVLNKFVKQCNFFTKLFFETTVSLGCKLE